MEFPTLSKYSEVTKEQMWQNYKEFVPVIKSDKFFISSYNRSNYGFNPMPPKFSGSYCMVDSSKVDYFKIDGITDFYTEDQRMCARKFYRLLSPADEWKDLGVSLEGLDHAAIRALRCKIYDNHTEATLFRPSWAKGVLKILFRSLIKHPLLENVDITHISVLDISAGWGDRLLACISLGLKYQGFDPNINLQTGHSNIINDFGHSDFHKIRYESFETATDIGKHHIVFTSPPFYRLEYYDDGSDQSIKRYPDFHTWMEFFLLASLKNAWDSLVSGGIMAIHLCDYYDQEYNYNLIQPVLNKVIQFDQASWLGVIGLQGERGKVWPIWCWRKD